MKSEKDIEQCFISVSQGCYAELTEKTNPNILGLISDAMTDCFHVIVFNKQTGYMALSHVDTLTDLADQHHGIEAWLKKAALNGDFTKVEINIGLRKEEIDTKITEIIERLCPNTENAPSITASHHTFAIAINRDFVINDDFDRVSDYIDNHNAILKEIPTPETLEEKSLSMPASINNARNRAAEYDEGVRRPEENIEPQPPICIFRDSDFLSIEEMKKEYVNINFDRVLKGKTTSENTSKNESDHEDYKEGNENDEISKNEKMKGSGSKTSVVPGGGDLTSYMKSNSTTECSDIPRLSPMPSGVNRNNDSSSIYK